MAYSMQSLTRSPDLAKRYFIETPDGKMVTKKECRIIFPETWVGRELAWVEGDIRVTTKFMVLIDNEYCISNECAYMPLTPDSVSSVIIDDVKCYELFFDKGSVVCPNLDLVVNNNILYYIFDEFISKGRVPPYFEYEDLGKMYLNSNFHTGVTLASNNTILEMVVASISRSSDDGMLHWRYKGKKLAESVKDKPFYISFTSPVYMASNTLSKISGAYFTNGLTSALTTKSEVTEPLEMLVRA